MARAEDEFEGYTSRELQELIPRIERMIAEKKIAEHKAIKDQLAAIASDAGFSIEEIFGGRQKRAYTKRPGAAPSVEVKYRNPDNPEETWSGRGRMANWLKEKIKKRGVKIEDFAA